MQLKHNVLAFACFDKLEIALLLTAHIAVFGGGGVITYDCDFDCDKEPCEGGASIVSDF